MDQLLARVGVSCSGRKKLLEGLEHSLSDTVLNLTVLQVPFIPSWKSLRILEVDGRVSRTITSSIVLAQLSQLIAYVPH